MATREQKPSEPPQDSPAESGNVADSEKPVFVPEKDLFVWKAHSRPFKKRSREYWVTINSIAALLAFVLFLAEGVMPVILIVSVVFLHYVMSTVVPEELEYKLTNRGVKIGKDTTFWDETTRYWFTKRFEYELLNVETFRFPGKLELVVLDRDKEALRKVLNKYLPEEEPEATSVDKAVNWVSKKLPQS